MSSNFGKEIQISIFGQSHSEAIGVVIDGLPAGEEIDLERIQAFMGRRAPGQHKYATPRKEADIPKVVSGLFEGKTCGAPICAVIENTNTRSKDYSKLVDAPRPGHADFTAAVKYGGFQDYRGGGHFSGRLTAPLCFAGAVCMQILERKGIHIGSHILSIHGEKDLPMDDVEITAAQLREVTAKTFPVFSDGAGERMKEVIEAARMEGDSVGGVVEAAAVGLPVGIGEPMFDGLESRLAAILFAIPAVKGVEFGAGFQAAELYGSENNDAFYYDEMGCVKTKTNHHGGSLGGISSGMPLTVRVAFKPTPSISKEQQTIYLSRKEGQQLQVTGRHDPCIVPRAVPVVEAALAVGLMDLYLMKH
ncbi:chorismate synthase [Anaerotignum lactatifermentans]|uniref:Chorismate synthase n=1 Tax=Anaerotignum lactatifermentans TaxID=160404 RepID=A0ABS2G7I1_9FIRM|nr:chorismate synthase [Anaerotignum lactatifermentans]MBM6828285.1 chorismate synthase [Anaerotignum lactatifermentans]MBM6876552.1 chorismate synthase [Anaerotignum lactatifermentans]MBM6949868.1 chorismate synthase [Anaerotignum lactatifermentans]